MCTEYGRRPGGLLALLLLAVSPCSGFSPTGARTSRARAPARRSARPACEAPRAAADDSAVTLAPRTVATQGYVAPEHLRTWKPFTYASPKERRAAAREFARGLSARQGREPGDMLPALPPIRVALLGGPSCGKGTLAPVRAAVARLPWTEASLHPLSHPLRALRLSPMPAARWPPRLPDPGRALAPMPDFATTATLRHANRPPLAAAASDDIGSFPHARPRRWPAPPRRDSRGVAARVLGGGRNGGGCSLARLACHRVARGARGEVGRRLRERLAA